MVSPIIKFISFCAKNASKQPQFIASSAQQPIASNDQKESLSSRLHCIRSSLKNQGIPEQSIQYICRSWRKSTCKQYDLVWIKWSIWCSQREINPLYPPESKVLEYLTSLASNGKSYSVINSHKAAIGQTLAVCGNNTISDSAVISRFMKGIYTVHPPKPKYTFTWDVSTVLKYLTSLMPLESLSLKDVTLKLTALLALSTAQRVQTINSFKINLMADFGDYVVFTIDELLKTSKPGKRLQKVKIDKFHNNSLCVVHTLKHYIELTSEKRKSDRLLISYKTYREISTSTIARWLKDILTLSGIDTNIFSAHSYRGASTSYAVSSGFSLSDVLSTANWSNAKTFHTFYHRETQSSFSTCVLSSLD